jgi:tetratricopeptide (TPR) repeat protein
LGNFRPGKRLRFQATRFDGIISAHSAAPLTPFSPIAAMDRPQSTRRPLRAIGALVCFALLAAAPRTVCAHAEVERALAGIDPSRAPDARAAAGAYLERAELHREAHQWDRARLDYDRAAALDPGAAGVALGRAALLLDQGRTFACEAALDAFIAATPPDPRAYELRARARAADGRFADAAADYDRWIDAGDLVTPDHFVRRARWLETAGQLDAALAGIEAGIARLGAVPGLVIEASEIESRLGRYAEAHARLARWGAELAAIRAGRHAAAPARPRAAPERRQTLPPDDGGGLPVLVTRGPYLQGGGADRVIVRWRTNVATDSRVMLNPALGGQQQQVSDGRFTTEHEVVLTGLLPGVAYSYSVGTQTYSSNLSLATSSFRTAPLVGSQGPTRIWILGDSGIAGAEVTAVRNAYTKWAGSHGADLVLMLGDNAYPLGTDDDYQAAVFDMFKSTIAETVLWPTRGNHDLLYAGAANDYYDAFTLPMSGECGGVSSGAEAYYSFDWANIHFICLDSEGSDRTRSGPMMRWLESDLATTTQPWIIPFWHHPPYSHGSHNSDDSNDSGGRMRDMREVALGILDSAGVDVVLTGHSHSYERSFLVRGHYHESWTLDEAMVVDGGDGREGGDGEYRKPSLGKGPLQGAVYPVLGCSGELHPGPLDHPVMVASVYSLGSMVMDIQGNRLDGRFIDDKCAVLDSFTIAKGVATAAVPPAPRSVVRLSLAARPNPVSSGTRLDYMLPRAGQVRLVVLDASGRRVRTLAAGAETAGAYSATWDGRDQAGTTVPPGIYFAQLTLAGERTTSRLVVLR